MCKVCKKALSLFNTKTEKGFKMSTSGFALHALLLFGAFVSHNHYNLLVQTKSDSLPRLAYVWMLYGNGHMHTWCGFSLIIYHKEALFVTLIN